MKKVKSQLMMLFICVLLGFMLTNKFRELNAKSNAAPENETEKTKVKNQIETMNEENKKLEKENNDIMQKIKSYEDQAAKVGNIDQATKNELDSARRILGISEDVIGKGIILTISPKSKLFSNDVIDMIQDRDLVYLVNELIAAGAEAVSINDKRITSQTGIRSSSGNSYILVNDEKVSPIRKITIKAIGDKKKLQEAMSKIDMVLYPSLTHYDLKVEASDTVTIFSYNKKYDMNYLKPVKTK